MEEKIKEMLKEKCSIGDCDETQGMFISVPMGNGLQEALPFCMEHALKFMKLRQEVEENAIKVAKILEQSDGSMVKIDSWAELTRKLKPEFLLVATQGLELTKGLCVECGKPAFGIKTLLTPVCGECYGFPRNVFKCALK